MFRSGYMLNKLYLRSEAAVALGEQRRKVLGHHQGPERVEVERGLQTGEVDVGQTGLASAWYFICVIIF